MTNLSRRKLIGFGLAGIVAAPSIVRAASIMRVRPLKPFQPWASGGVAPPTDLIVGANGPEDAWPVMMIDGFPMAQIEFDAGISPKLIYIDGIPIQAPTGEWNFSGILFYPDTGKWTGDRVPH